jgi:hypothetical protein
MSQRTHPVRITLPLAATDYRVFLSATRQLRRIMGRNAPDVLALIQFNLQDRDATGIADDYLDAIRWPNSAGRVVTLARRAKPRRAARTIRHARPSTVVSRTSPLRSRTPADPSRN